MAVDANTLQQWVGRSEWATDQVTLVPVRALSAILDRDPAVIQPGDPLPPLWHWLYFLPVHRQSQLGADGHSQRGGFLPPVPLPRRMWAGSRVQFYHSIRVGETLSRQSVISAVNHKEGRSGSLIFVTVSHEISNPQGLALREEQDLVYRENPKPGDAALAPKAAPEPPTWQRNIRPDEVMLFRYSALTFNAHRIHYDRRYATTVEGYPGLVVHGPLVATLLLDLLHQNLTKAIVSEFVFRAVRPLFDAAAFSVRGRIAADNSVELWAQDAEGCLAMEATAKLA